MIEPIEKDKSTMKTFVNDDDGFFAWIRSNPNGFVVNVQGESNPYKLHKATCYTIENIVNPTGTGYTKVCSLNKQELLQLNKRGYSDFECRVCNP